MIKKLKYKYAGHMDRDGKNKGNLVETTFGYNTIRIKIKKNKADRRKMVRRNHKKCRLFIIVYKTIPT